MTLMIIICQKLKSSCFVVRDNSNSIGIPPLMRNSNENSKLDHRELSDTELAAASGGRNQPTRHASGGWNPPTKHPAKVTVPDLKLG